MGVEGVNLDSVKANSKRARAAGFKGNLHGEGLQTALVAVHYLPKCFVGRLLGGLLVVSPKTGIVFEHREEVFGDHADRKTVMNEAIKLSQRSNL